MEVGAVNVWFMQLTFDQNPKLKQSELCMSKICIPLYFDIVAYPFVSNADLRKHELHAILH
jgi:hypothetical protein